jgi:hypothetical protein
MRTRRNRDGRGRADGRIAAHPMQPAPRRRVRAAGWCDRRGRGIVRPCPPPWKSNADSRSTAAPSRISTSAGPTIPVSSACTVFRMRRRICCRSPGRSPRASTAACSSPPCRGTLRPRPSHARARGASPTTSMHSWPPSPPARSTSSGTTGGPWRRTRWPTARRRTCSAWWGSPSRRPSPSPRNLRAAPAQLGRSRYMAQFQFPGLSEALVRRGDFAFVAELWARWSPTYAATPAQLATVRAALSPPGALTAALDYYPRAALALRLGRERRHGVRAHRPADARPDRRPGRLHRPGDVRAPRAGLPRPLRPADSPPPPGTSCRRRTPPGSPRASASSWGNTRSEGRPESVRCVDAIISTNRARPSN